MQLELIDEEEMATKPKKPIEPRKGPEVKTTHKPRTTEVKEERPSDGSGGPRVPGSSGDSGVRPNIVKRIYFPGDTYSNKENQKEFKKILANHRLTWVKGMMRSYPRKDGTALLTGMYVSEDQNKKVFCIYEGTNKPMTAIVKIMGSGGLFIIDLNSYCHKVGCTVEDKDEAYVNNTLLTLQEKGEIYVEKKMETKSLEEIHREHEEKIEKVINQAIDKFVEAHRFVYDTYCESLFWKRGLSENFIRKFRRMEIEKDIRQAVGNGRL